MSATLTKTDSYLLHRGKAAAANFLAHDNCEVVDTDTNSDIFHVVAVSENGTLIFVNVAVAENTSSFPKCNIEREQFEEAAVNYLKLHDYTDVAIRFDEVSIIVIAKDRAFVRRHVNSLGCSLEKEAA